MKDSDLGQIIRFTIPVTLEHLLTQFIGMIIPALIGGISGSALAAVGIVNQTATMYTSFFALMSTGGAVLLARSAGSGDYRESSRIVEQDLLMTLLASVFLAMGSLALTRPILKLLMRSAEENMFAEAVTYFRFIMLSLPPYLMYVVSTAMLRAAGNSRGPMVITLILNAVQVLTAYLLIKVAHMGIAGAGLAFVVARCVGMILAMMMLFRHHRSFQIQFSRIFRPHLPTWIRIMRIGVPDSMQSTLLQGGYLVANSMIVGLGTHPATVYQVVNTLYGFASFPMGVCGPILISFVGRKLGAGDERRAKKTLWGIYLAGMCAELLLSLVIVLNVGPLSRLYSSDAAVLKECRIIVWYMFGVCISAMSINAMDPGLRTGGDGKCIMWYTLFGVWAVRVPLTWLFCYPLGMGVPGVYIANIISLTFRALCSQYRFHSGKWLHKNV